MIERFWQISEEKFDEIKGLIEFHLEFDDSQGKELRSLLRLIALSMKIKFHERWDDNDDATDKVKKEPNP